MFENRHVPVRGYFKQKIAIISLDKMPNGENKNKPPNPLKGE